MPEELNSFIKTQYAFAAYIRDPKKNPPPPGLEKRRLEMYRELFFNNVEGFLAGNFPVLKSTLDDAHWHHLVEDFFSGHRCKTPYFAGIPEEFLDYLQNERGEHPEDPDFMLELAHYEWAEMALAVAEGEAPEQDPSLQEDPLSQRIVLSELAWPLAYRYPVQRISADFQSHQPPSQPTYLVIYRDHQDEVKFLEINSVTYRLLQLVQQGGLARDCLRQIAKEIQHPNPDTVLRGGAEILRGLAQRRVIQRAER